MKNQILELFKKNPHSELSTSSIVSLLEKNKIDEINAILADTDLHSPDKVREAKRLKAQLHRKTLYHLNNYIDDGILKVVKEGEKGEKYFSLDIDDGEEIVIDKYKKRDSMVISKPMAIPIEGYEQKGIVQKLDPSTWIERLNAMLIESGKFTTLKELLHFITSSFSNVNDVVCLNDFEHLIEKFDIAQVISFSKKLSIRCSDYGKKVSLILDMTNLKSKDKALVYIADYLEHKQQNITIVFDTTNREFHDNWPFFEYEYSISL